MGTDVPCPKIGWLFCSHGFKKNDAYNADKRVDVYCAKYGKMGFSFINFPLGGIYRYNWEPSPNEEVPRIHLPDLQLDIHFWQNCVNCALSRWIDPDSSIDWLGELSIQQFHKEIDYAKYLGVNSVSIELRHVNSPKLAELINFYLSSPNFDLNFWMFLPTNAANLENSEDSWLIWRNFRTLCGNCKQISVGLSFTEDLGREFTLENFELFRRWNAEPLVCILIDYSLFIRGNGSTLALTRSHSKLLAHLITSSRQHLLLSSPSSCDLDKHQKGMLFNTVRQELLATNQSLYEREAFLADYLDVLQIPLQPLSINLEASVYNTFELDQPKYDNYSRAIGKAIEDLLNLGFAEIVLMVLGAGRGPLVSAALSAGNELKKAGKVVVEKSFVMRVFAVEKNPNAVVSLEYCNEERWDNVVSIVQSDMRSLATFVENGKLERPDIIISELLGSFGDNELCPECLDGVNNILKEHTISIPSSYTSFLTPMQSLRLFQNIRDVGKNSFQQTNGREIREIATDQMHVVCPSQFCYLACTQECFKFRHPNRENASNFRKCSKTFRIPRNSELLGFAAHFEVVLHKNITLSTHPERHTEKLFSWFPGLFPLRQLFFSDKDCDVTFHISRNFDAHKVWYEWFIEHKDGDDLVRSEVQNLGGACQSMNLF